MTNLINKRPAADAPVVPTVDGKTVEPRDCNWPERFARFLVRSLFDAWHHRDPIGQCCSTRR